MIKKISKFLILPIILLLCALAILAYCNKPTADKLTITFDSQGGSSVQAIRSAAGKIPAEQYTK